MTILFLNGTSSSGKTTLARMLQEMSEELYYYISLDTYYNSLPPKILKQVVVQGNDENKKKLLNWRFFWRGLFSMAAALNKVGNNVILDVVCYNSILNLCFEEFRDLNVVYIGVKCSLEELERREISRGDRYIGMVKSQYHPVYDGQIFDLEINTEKNPKEAAMEIISWLKTGHPAYALSILSKKYNFQKGHLSCAKKHLNESCI